MRLHTSATPTHQHRQACEHFYNVARLKNGTLPPFSNFTLGYIGLNFYPMMVAGVYTFIHKDILVDVELKE